MWEKRFEKFTCNSIKMKSLCGGFEKVLKEREGVKHICTVHDYYSETGC